VSLKSTARMSAIIAAASLVGLAVFGPFNGAFAADTPPDPTTSQSAVVPTTTTPEPAAPAADPVPAQDPTTQEAAPAEPATPPAPAATETPATPVAEPAPVAAEPVKPAATPVDAAAPAVLPAAPAAKVAQQSQYPAPKKVFVCKYVGTPGVDERLQTGNNPISVSVNAIQHNHWDGTVPGWFSDAHDRSFVLAYDTGQPKPDVSSCPAAEQPPVEDCVKNPQWSYTLDYATMSGTVTATGGEKFKVGDKLCDELAIRAAKREYTTQNSVWPQGAATFNDTLVDKLGTFNYSVPNWKNQCEQADVHAQWASKGGFSALVMSPVLYGPQNPTEPPFLHDILNGKGPNPTWKQTSAEGCNVPVPEVVTGTATFTVETCEPASKNWISAEAVHGGIWSISDNEGHSQDLAAIGEGYEGGLPDGLAYGKTYTVSLRDGDSSDLYTVTPWSGEWTPVHDSPSCYPTDAFARTDVANQATCDANSTVEFMIENATWNTPADLSVGDHTRTATAIQGYLFPAERSVGSTTMEVAYTIKPALGHQSTDAKAPCYVAPPKTTPPTVPTVNVQQPLPPSGLADTGSNISGAVAPFALLLLLGGIASVAVSAIRRRRKATNE
jgi:hypothetical protein